MEGGVPRLDGREAELRAVEAAIAADRAVAVVGEAGIGKTALVRAAAFRAGRPMREGGGLATLRQTPYFALRRAVGATLAGDPVTVAADVERIVGPDGLFVDDLHWADDETLATLELLADRILVVVGLRSGDPDSDRAAGTIRAMGAEVVTLRPLDDATSAALVARLRPDLGQAATAEIVRRSGGNPLLIEELAAFGTPSPTMTRALTRRLDRLSTSARSTVELAAVVGRALPRAALGTAAGEAIAAGVLVEHDGGVEIRHELVAAAIEAGLTVARRRALHRRAAAVVPDAIERARHLAAGGRRAAAVALARTAAQQTSDLRARAAALVIAAEAGRAADALQMRLEAARALDEVADWATISRILGEPASRGAPEDLVERDAILAHATFALGDIDASRRHLAAAQARRLDPANPAATRRTIETATLMVNLDGAVGPALALLDSAVGALPAGAAGCGELAILRSCIGLLAGVPGDPSSIAAAEEAAFSQGRYRTATDQARVVQYLLLMAVGSEATLAFLIDHIARYETAGLGAVAREFQADAALAAYHSGRLADAIRTADELLERPAPPRAHQTAEIAKARALVLLGRFDEAETNLARLQGVATRDFFGVGEVLTAQAELALASGQPARAAKLVEAALEVPAPVPAAHATPIVVRALARAGQGIDPGEPPPTLAPSVAGATVEVEALALLFRDDPRAAAAAFDSAAAAWAGYHEPRSLACRAAAADALRLADDRGEAVARLEAVLGQAIEMGAETVAARVRRSLRLAGVRVVAPSRRTGPRVAGLTARERELVRLVQRGLTNIEIARRLGLGRPTVARILASAMTKLGADSRGQLAAAIEA